MSDASRGREHAVSGLLLVVAITQFVPVVGVVGAETLASLYDIEIQGKDLEILMRHRAVLFGLLGGFIGAAALRREFQPAAFVAGFVSIGSFVGLAAMTDGFNDAIRKLVVIDLLALVCLLGAFLFRRGLRIV